MILILKMGCHNSFTRFIQIEYHINPKNYFYHIPRIVFTFCDSFVSHREPSSDCIKRKRNGKGMENLKTDKDKFKGCVAIPYVKGLSESVAMVMKKTWHISIHETTLHAEENLSQYKR